VSIHLPSDSSVKLPNRHYLCEDGSLIITDARGGIIVPPTDWVVAFDAPVLLRETDRDWVEEWDHRYATRPWLEVTGPPSHLVTRDGVEPVRLAG
jgi:hypothetical protein